MMDGKLPNFIFLGRVINYNGGMPSCMLLSIDYNRNQELRDLVTYIMNKLYGTSGNLLYIGNPYVGKPGYPTYAISVDIYEKIIQCSLVDDKEDLELLLRLI